jgi:GNAT superfamily N-acetyltransferase
MRIIVIDQPHRNQGSGGQFLALCERWLKQQKLQALHIESSPAAYQFYLRHGYLEMPFNDPDHNETHPDDIAMGKKL